MEVVRDHLKKLIFSIVCLWLVLTTAYIYFWADLLDFWNFFCFNLITPAALDRFAAAAAAAASAAAAAAAAAAASSL